jgi:TolB protein
VYLAHPLFFGGIIMQKWFLLSFSALAILISCDSFLTSPDNISKSKIAFIGQENNAAQVYTINSDGTGLKQLTQSSTTRITSPRWLPNEDLLSFWKSGVLHITDQSGITTEQVAGSIHLGPPNHWSPDGQLFTAYGMHNTRQEIYLLSLQNSHLRKFSQGEGQKFAGTWSPDGLYVAYIAELAPNLREIIISDEQGSILKKKQISLPVNYLKWSPDGNSLIVGDSFRLRILNTNSLELTEISGIKENIERAYQPVWSLDSKSLAFNFYEYDSGVVKLLSYELETSNMDELFSYETDEFIYLRLSPDWHSVIVEHAFIDKPLYISELNTMMNPRFRTDDNKYITRKLTNLPASVSESSAVWSPIR